MTEHRPEDQNTASQGTVMSEKKAEEEVYACGYCGKPIETGCYCSEKCARADDDDFDPYEAAGESRFSLPGGGNSL